YGRRHSPNASPNVLAAAQDAPQDRSNDRHRNFNGEFIRKPRAGVSEGFEQPAMIASYASGVVRTPRAQRAAHSESADYVGGILRMPAPMCSPRPKTRPRTVATT